MRWKRVRLTIHLNSSPFDANGAPIKACLSSDEARAWNGSKQILGYGG
jgi:hypothetical protein